MRLSSPSSVLTSHSVNTVLHRIKRSDSPHCPHCPHGIRETLYHYLLAYPHYAGSRRLLQARLRRGASSIPFLLGSKIGIPHLPRYVSDTNRLRTTFGEVRPADGFVIGEKKTKERPPRRSDNREQSPSPESTAIAPLFNAMPDGTGICEDNRLRCPLGRSNHPRPLLTRLPTVAPGFHLTSINVSPDPLLKKNHTRWRRRKDLKEGFAEGTQITFLEMGHISQRQ